MAQKRISFFNFYILIKEYYCNYEKKFYTPKDRFYIELIGFLCYMVYKIKKNGAAV